jgi:DNA-binding response OmpR family regulator
MDKRILVIDDEQLIVKSTCILLRYMGYRTLEAFSGAEGIQAARKERPDFILLDLVMPDLDGWHVLSLLQEDAATAGIPVIIFTAKEYANAEMVGNIQGARGHIRKPFEPEDLEEAIRRLDAPGR